MAYNIVALRNDISLRLDVNVKSQDIATNRTTFSYVLQLVKTNAGRTLSTYNSSSWTVRTPYSNIIASGTLSSVVFNASTSSITIKSGEITLPHNADGTFSGRQWAGAFNDSSGLIGAGTVYLERMGAPTIPRATTPAVSGSFTTGVAKTISLPRASAAFTHDVSYVLGSQAGTIVTGAGTAWEWTPPHNLFEGVPDLAAASIRLTVVTKNGSSIIGTKQIYVPISLAADQLPSVSELVLQDTNETVATNIGAAVQGLSRLAASFTAEGIHGSTIASKTVTIAGAVFDADTIITPSIAGDIAITATATDSRGRAATSSSTLTVLPYSTPGLLNGGVTVERANAANAPDPNGQYLRAVIHARASSLNVAGSEKNALTISIRTKASNAGWVQRNTINPGLTQSATPIQLSGGAVYLQTLSYQVEITLTDKTGATTVINRTVPTASVTLDLNGTKVGVGKMHELGALDVAGQIYSNGVLVSTASQGSWGEIEQGSVTTKFISPYTFSRRNGYLQGTETQRTNTAYKPHGTLFRVNSGKEYVSDGTNWRQKSGVVSFPAAAWQFSQAPVYGRTVNLTVPVKLAANETLRITANEVGNSFAFISKVSETVNDTDTTVVIRFVQFGSAAQNGGSVIWEIIPI